MPSSWVYIYIFVSAYRTLSTVKNGNALLFKLLNGLCTEMGHLSSNGGDVDVQQRRETQIHENSPHASYIHQTEWSSSAVPVVPQKTMML